MRRLITLLQKIIHIIKKKRYEMSLKKKESSETKDSPPPIVMFTINQTIKLPKIELIEGKICRDGSATHKSTPCIGDLYLCIGVSKNKKVITHKSRAYKLSSTFEKFHESKCKLFSHARPTIYMLHRCGDKFPIFISDQGEIAHYLINNWSIELYSCYKLETKPLPI